MDLRIFETLDDLPVNMRAEALAFQKDFRVAFDRFYWFAPEILKSLHAASANQSGLEHCRICTDERAIKADRAALYRGANRKRKPTKEQRQEYLSALKRIYGRLPVQPPKPRKGDGILFVGIEREGRMLGESLKWLTTEDDHCACIHVKRIRVDDGILVGMRRPKLERAFNRVEIIDGAIASGATTMAVIDELKCKEIRIYSVHAAAEGARALSKFARDRNVDLQLSVGYVTEGLNESYYAKIYSKKLVVGDLGDMIAPLFAPAQ